MDPNGPLPGEQDHQRFHQAYQAAYEYAQDPRGWFVLVGPSSSGKTQLAAAIANHVLQQGHPPLFMTAPDLLDHLRATFAPAADLSYDELFEQLRNTLLLVLDDLGAHASTSWAHEKLYQLLNHRANAQLPTVITVRGHLEELDEHLQGYLHDRALSQVRHLSTVLAPSLLQHLSNLSEEQRKRQTFANFDVRGNQANDNQRNTLEAAKRAAQSFAAHPDGWLVLAGPPGCGKTHLAVAVVNRCLELGQPAFYTKVPDLLDHLREAFAPNADIPYRTRFDQVRDAKLLVLDDLGAQSSTPWANEKLYQIIDYRYDARSPTVITTNRRIVELTGESFRDREALSDVISSRLKDGKLVELHHIDAPDFRNSARRGASSEGRNRPPPRR